MSYQVLARKWRPKRFADLVGQEHVVRALSNALAENRLHHAYLLTGTRGVGKTTIARILAKSLNCEQGAGAEPCGVCSSCTQIDAGRFVDLLEIDAASNTGIDNIREVLENAQYAPSSGRFKVYIIDEVHMLSKSAFNAMLKTLEEPPSHVKFILATTDPQKVPVTVLSRCLQFSLRNMTPQQVAGHLAYVLDAEQVPFEPAALALLGRAAAGSMRDALSLLDQAIAYGIGTVEEGGVRAMLGAIDRRYLFTLLEALADNDGPRLLAEADSLAELSVGFDHALAELALLLHQVALAQTVPAALAPDEPERDAIFSLAERLAPEDVQLYYQIAVHGRKDLPLAPDEHAGFNMALLRMLAFHPARLPAAGGGATKAPAVRSASSPASTPVKTPQPAAAVPAHAPQAAARPSEPVAEPAPEPEPAAEPAPPKAAEPTQATPQVPPQSVPRAADFDVPPWMDEAPPPDGWDDAPRAVATEARRETAGKPAPAAAKPAEPAPTPIAPQAQPESQTSAEPAGPFRFDGDWLNLADHLMATAASKLGMARMLLENAVLKRIDGERWHLAIAPAFANHPGAARESVQKLKEAISACLDQSIEVYVETDASIGETPALRRARHRNEQLAAARTSLENDPVVKAFEREFGAVLLTDTIQPIQE
ncbi:DNA polymerase III subunit gamma/tau [Crenobacter cavernae]|uniref:DNA polymerase III subunit gamma/tau n=1 Tax=Crenobacter cavernae TaxID=2290923 RepID=A0A345YAF0_9NEIS|nr:DNA polymerase III subunit gamma/tau [Crenobacter cavernae]AXK40902.1 DNA polymerase III subunit gamma/tau [Crenobacter cavernae]